MPGRFDGKVVLISGAGGTKGLALAQCFATEGAKVYVTDVDESRVADVARQTEHPENVTYRKLDVGSEADWRQVVDQIAHADGRIDVLVNSPRLFGVGRIEDIGLDEWRRCTAANLDGTFLGAKTVLPLMVKSGGGSIINVISIAALRTHADTPNYGACNAAALNLLKTIAVQYAPHNIRANGLVVGFSSNSPMDDTVATAKRVIPLGRPANGMDIAKGVLWLASDDASYVTGAGLTLDGGWSLGLHF